MRGFLGEKIGEGVTSDIHVWAPGQVVKLFKAGVPPRFGRHEARMTRAAFAAGAPAPDVLGEVSLEGRFGIVLPRFDGPTLLHLVLTRAMTYEQVGSVLATLYLSVHRTSPPPGTPSLRDWIDTASRSSGDLLPEHLATGVLTLIDRLPPDDGLCHADLHPGNVIMTAGGPRIIDWVCAARAPAIFDIGRCHVTLSELVPEDADPEPPRAINAAVQSEYARLTGMSPAELTATMQPYLPILRTFVLLQRPSTPVQRERLIQRIATALLSEDGWQAFDDRSSRILNDCDETAGRSWLRRRPRDRWRLTP
jgi:Ser/Thr protein kinase RdoA (MazF antagonist)